MLNGLLSLFSSFVHFILGINTPQSYPPPLSQKEEEHLFAEISLFVILCLIMIIRFTSRIIYKNSLLKKVIKKPTEEDEASVGQ